MCLVSLTTEGILEVIQSGKLLGDMRPGTAFGELAILYNCKRTATVKGEWQQHRQDQISFTFGMTYIKILPHALVCVMLSVFDNHI